MAEIELSPQGRRGELLNKLVMGVPIGHSPVVYQRVVDMARGQSFMARSDSVNDKRLVGFGARLSEAIDAAGWKSQRQFVIDGLKWDEATGPQRLSNYIKKDRVPDPETLGLICSTLKVSRDDLLNEGHDAALRDILLRLFELEGIPADRADTIATVFLAAKRLLATYPQDGEPGMLARLAAQSAWQLQSPQSPDR